MVSRRSRGKSNTTQNIMQENFPSSSGHTVLIENDSDTTIEEGTSLPNDGVQVLGRGVKELVQAVQALRQLGVEDLNLPLPKIVVVGDQSTGKSSLIEGISEIKVPRSAGTCTRCPLEINLTESTNPDASWDCHIVLHRKYVYEGNSGIGRGKNNSKTEGATRVRPLGPWAEQQPADDQSFAYVTSKDEIVDALERAQLAILNPGTSFERYKPGLSISKRDHQVKFSPNVIRLDISGPGLPNLSFFDLPGVINVSEVPEEAYLVDLVRNLVREYTKTDNCVNLLALTMTHDVANSSAFGLIKEMKAEGRTVGCLTKPDNMGRGESLDQWVQILGGQLFRLGYGYHVIKNNPDHRVNHATARVEEAAFFDGREPWTTELSCYHDRFGTLQLQAALSQRLTAQIRTSLPRIIDQVQCKADIIKAQLRELPEPPSNNLPAVVMGELKEFKAELQKHVDGGSANFPFQKDWDTAAKKFRQDLVESCPVLILPSSRMTDTVYSPYNVPSTPTPAARNVAPIPIDTDDDMDDSPPKSHQAEPRSGMKRQHASIHSTPIKRPRSANASAAARSTLVLGFAGKRFGISEVHGMLQEAYIGLPNEVDPRATERMIILSMAHWETPLNTFLDQTRQLCEFMVFNVVEKRYGKYRQTQYYEEIRAICETFFTNAFIDHGGLVKKILVWEQKKPKTFDVEALDSAEGLALELLQNARRESRAKEFLDHQETRAGKALSTGQARYEKLSKITDVQLGPDKYSREIRVMARVKAYYNCALSRFVDVVCSSISCELFAKCREDIVARLMDKLDPVGDDAQERLGLLLASNPEQERRRKQLLKDLETVTKAQERLQGLTGEE